MPRFLAVYTMKPEDLARFRSLPKPEQNAIDTIGIRQWADWEERNAASFPDRGGMVGKTTRVTKDLCLSRRRRGHHALPHRPRALAPRPC